MTKEILTTHLLYTAWASTKLVEAAGRLSLEDLTRDFGTSDHSVLGTLVHVFAADRIWLCRVTETQPPERFLHPEEDMRLEVLQTDWPELLERWKQWATGLSDPNIVIRYQDLKGNHHQSTAWQIILHVVNHGTHHRGQAAGFLRSMGHTPPPLDLIAYYRQKPLL